MASSSLYTGMKEISVQIEYIDELYNTGKLDITRDDLPWDRRYKVFQNQFITLKNGESHSAITRFKGTDLILVKKQNKKDAGGIIPRNREQLCALDLLLDDDVPIVILTGISGSGKTIIATAAAIHKMRAEKYKKLILTRPMSQVGKDRIGYLPGSVQEKFGPYLSNYINNLEQITGDPNFQNLPFMNQIDFLPISLIRGASWVDSFVIADEIQILDNHEMVSLGTRVGEKSKIVIMGDLNQRDERIAIDKTGLYKFVNDSRTKESPLVGVVELKECVRSEVSKLFTEVFEV